MRADKEGAQRIGGEERIRGIEHPVLHRHHHTLVVDGAQQGQCRRGAVAAGQGQYRQRVGRPRMGAVAAQILAAEPVVGGRHQGVGELVLQRDQRVAGFLRLIDGRGGGQRVLRINGQR
ncbi:hypothetical protein D3C87_1767560 [compost metagenome]